MKKICTFASSSMWSGLKHPAYWSLRGGICWHCGYALCLCIIIPLWRLDWRTCWIQSLPVFGYIVYVVLMMDEDLTRVHPNLGKLTYCIVVPGKVIFSVACVILSLSCDALGQTRRRRHLLPVGRIRWKGCSSLQIRTGQEEGTQN